MQEFRKEIGSDLGFKTKWVIFQNSHRDNPGSLNSSLFLQWIGFLYVHRYKKEDLEFEPLLCRRKVVFTVQAQETLQERQARIQLGPKEPDKGLNLQSSQTKCSYDGDVNGASQSAQKRSIVLVPSAPEKGLMSSSDSENLFWGRV